MIACSVFELYWHRTDGRMDKTQVADNMIFLLLKNALKISKSSIDKVSLNDAGSEGNGR